MFYVYYVVPWLFLITIFWSKNVQLQLVLIWQTRRNLLNNKQEKHDYLRKQQKHAVAWKLKQVALKPTTRPTLSNERQIQSKEILLNPHRLRIFQSRPQSWIMLVTLWAFEQFFVKQHCELSKIKAHLFQNSSDWKRWLACQEMWLADSSPHNHLEGKMFVNNRCIDRQFIVSNQHVF